MSVFPNCSAPADAPLASPMQGVIRLLVWCVLCAGLPVLLMRGERTKKGVPAALHSPIAQEVIDVKKTIAELQAARPEYIGIGNSMLYTRLGKTPGAMNTLTGRKFFFIIKNGSSSAAWYLTLKNVVAASGVHPRLVFFFIRDNDLTSPFFRTAGDYAVYLNSLRGPQEPVLDDLLHAPPAKQGVVGRLSERLNGPGGLYSFPAWDEKIPRHLIDMAMDMGSAGAPKTEMRSSLSARFAIEHLRGDMAADLPAPGSGDGYAPDSYNDLNGNYVDSEKRSFLPAMMQVAEKHGLKLLFFRVKRRPDASGNVTDEPPELRPYAQHLQHWIEERGGLFHDESYDPTIPREAYRDGDHIGEEHMDWYRKYFWQRMSSVFP